MQDQIDRGAMAQAASHPLLRPSQIRSLPRASLNRQASGGLQTNTSSCHGASLPPAPAPAPALPSSSFASSTINSAALQQQLSRSLNLNAAMRSYRRRSSSVTSNSSQLQRRSNAAHVSSSGSDGFSVAPTSWACESCTLINAAGTARCSA